MTGKYEIIVCKFLISIGNFGHVYTENETETNNAIYSFSQEKKIIYS